VGTFVADAGSEMPITITSYQYHYDRVRKFQTNLGTLVDEYRVKIKQ
jgi:hypothetical protein